jgi:hypothetical protein
LIDEDADADVHTFNPLGSDVRFLDDVAPPSSAAAGEKDTKFAQKLGQLQPFLAAAPTIKHGQACIFWASLTPFSFQPRLGMGGGRRTGRNRYGVQGVHLSPLGLFLPPPYSVDAVHMEYHERFATVLDPLTQRTCFPQAPELLSRRIETFDARALLATDVFSLGVTLFHVLTAGLLTQGVLTFSNTMQPPYNHHATTIQSTKDGPPSSIYRADSSRGPGGTPSRPL